MKRLALMISVLAVGLVATTSASAKRRATAKEAAAVINVVNAYNRHLSPGALALPVRCELVYISTVNRTWATQEFNGADYAHLPAACADGGKQGRALAAG
jgi:hypothetical protein